MTIPSRLVQATDPILLSRRQLLLAGSAAALGAPTAGVHAQAGPAWPSKEVRIVTGWSPGGNADILARMLGDHIGKTSKFPVVVENRPGAAGALGAQAVVRAAPDGHTLLMASMAEIMVVPPLTVERLQYDPEKDLIPVTLFGEWPLLLLVNKDFPVNSVPELVAYCKSNASKVNFGSSGIGTINHFLGALLNQEAGIRTVHVPYKGASPMLNDLASGQIQFAFDSFGSSGPLIRAGKIKPIAVTGSKRLRTLGEVQSMAEAGYPAVDTQVWVGLFAPAKTPPEIVAKVHAQAVEALREPAVRKAMEEREMYPVGNTPEQFKAGLRSETDKKRELAMRIGIKAD